MQPVAPSLVIVIPYRDRAANLARIVPALKAHLAGFLHKIAVIEQAGSAPFNKGRLMNAGFDLYRGENAYFCFHDVDLVPEGPTCDYSYPKYPTHLSVHCSQLGYKLPYDWLCGGVMLFRKGDFVAVNGYSNEFWGWGGEDDDMGFRLRHFRMRIDRSRPGRYRSLPHARAAGAGTSLHHRNLTRLWSHYDYRQDGLSTLAYRVLEADDGPGYKRFLIEVGSPPNEVAARSPRPRPAAQAHRVVIAPNEPKRPEPRSAPLVSCLCVTESRAAFMPWLLWCFDRQVWKERELVIVDSSRQPFSVPGRADVRVVAASRGATLPQKRNLALDAARGDAIAWFDDDDWQHPHRLAELVDILRQGAPLAGTTRGWFIDLLGGGASLYTSSTIVFNGAMVWRDVAMSTRFDLARARGGEDTAWMRALASKIGRNACPLYRDMFFWLSHDRNIINRRSRRRFLNSLAEVRRAVGSDAWGDTDVELERLRKRYLDRVLPMARGNTSGSLRVR
jgi:glycosyltransferase involved in cell wall biosynthesis